MSHVTAAPFDRHWRAFTVRLRYLAKWRSLDRNWISTEPVKAEVPRLSSGESFERIVSLDEDWFDKFTRRLAGKTASRRAVFSGALTLGLAATTRPFLVASSALGLIGATKVARAQNGPDRGNGAAEIHKDGSVSCSESQNGKQRVFHTTVKDRDE